VRARRASTPASYARTRIALPDLESGQFDVVVAPMSLMDVEDYMAAPLDCGLQLRGFVESDVTDEELQRSHRFRKLKRIPYFLFMRWMKE
jgi:hypothetical protein